MADVATRLLVVDDEPSGRLALSRRLVKRGYSVDTAEGGAEALDKILADHYDLILLDQRMPGMNGVDLLRLLRATYSQAELPVIMVTGVDENQSIVEALEEGANDYVVKPVEIPEINARIQAQLALARHMRGAGPAGPGRANSASTHPEKQRIVNAVNPPEKAKPVSLFPSQTEALWEWNPVSSLAYFSSAWKQLLGYRDEDVGGELSEWLDRIHPQDLIRVRKELKTHIDGGNPEFRSEHRLQHKTGEYQWVLCRAISERSASGQMTRLSGSFIDIEDRKAVDSLTGLGNRLHLLDRLTAALSPVAAPQPAAGGFRNGGDLPVPSTPNVQWIVALLDLDGFKAFNETAGHEAADQLLIEIASRLRQSVGRSIFAETATVARIGADEFAVLAACPNSLTKSTLRPGFLDRVSLDHGPLSKSPLIGPPPNRQGTCSMAHVTTLAELLLASVAAPVAVGDDSVRVAASVGIALGVSKGRTADEMLRDAELALRSARSQGGHRWCMFESSMRGRDDIRSAVARDLRHAVEREELLVLYQPKIDLRTRRISGFEALLRWNHPEHGLLPPNEFIPMAEETGFIVPAGEWILHQACRQLKAWQEQFPQDAHQPPLEMSVNLSVRQLTDPDIVPVVRSALHETGLPASCLKLELTESSLLEEKDVARTVLKEIQAMGVGLMLDDFGTGYASLSYLSVLKFDSLKIDRSFVMRMDIDAESRAIIKTILALARELNMGVIAEGIETERQLGMLLELGCESGQGYLFSKPVTEVEAGQLLLLDRDRTTLLKSAGTSVGESHELSVV